MLAGFVAIVMSGHFYCTLLIFFVNVGIFREILSLKRNLDKETKIPYFMFLNWYFFSVAIFYEACQLLQHKLVTFLHQSQILSQIIVYHNLITFMLWVIGFLLFVVSLKKGFYRYQFR
jgi:phosphatidate cytidylyltransferase